MLIVFTVLSCGQCGGGERALSQGVTHAPREGDTWSTCSNWIFLNLKFSCQSTGTPGLQLQPCSRAWSSSHCQRAAGAQRHWGPWDGAPSHPHCHQQQPAGQQRTEQQVEKGWSSPGWERRSQGWNGQDGECSNRERTKEGRCEKEKEANPSSGCWREQ